MLAGEERGKQVRGPVTSDPLNRNSPARMPALPGGGAKSSYVNESRDMKMKDMAGAGCGTSASGSWSSRLGSISTRNDTCC